MYENPFRKVEQKFYENIIRKIADISSAQDNAIPVSTIGYNKTENYETMSTEELRERGANGDQEAIAEWKRRIIERNQFRNTKTSNDKPDLERKTASKKQLQPFNRLYRELDKRRNVETYFL